MLDIKFIRQNSELVKNAAAKKCFSVDIDELLRLDNIRKSLLQEIEEFRSKQNQNSEKITAIKNKKEKEKLLNELKNLKYSLSEKEKEFQKTEKPFKDLMLRVPNVPDPLAPVGKDETFNQEIRKSGDIPSFDFPVKDHIELMEKNGWLDLERGTKVSGFRGYFLKGRGALLSFAIWEFVLKELINKGFEPFLAPALAREAAFVGSGWFPLAKEDVYQVDDDLYLIGTSEVPIMGYHQDEILNEKDLPKKYVAFSPCFRKEAGAYGRDTKGIFRLHEFYKIEQVILCKADPQESVKWHEEITYNSEEIMQKLDIPYRVVLNSTGELGLGQVKKYDIEAWFPSQNRYRETHSASILHDFQTRRLNIRYRDGGKLYFAHSLNNTAIATPRVLAALTENYQQKDGAIKIPKVLEEYL